MLFAFCFHSTSLSLESSDVGISDVSLSYQPAVSHVDAALGREGGAMPLGDAAMSQLLWVTSAEGLSC